LKVAPMSCNDQQECAPILASFDKTNESVAPGKGVLTTPACRRLG
jgi:hypothetical protein